jgi:hypothetical protein
LTVADYFKITALATEKNPAVIFRCWPRAAALAKADVRVRTLPFFQRWVIRQRIGKKFAPPSLFPGFLRGVFLHWLLRGDLIFGRHILRRKGKTHCVALTAK